MQAENPNYIQIGEKYVIFCSVGNCFADISYFVFFPKIMLCLEIIFHFATVDSELDMREWQF